jgi:hypothetical protein
MRDALSPSLVVLCCLTLEGLCSVGAALVLGVGGSMGLATLVIEGAEERRLPPPSAVTAGRGVAPSDARVPLTT